MESYALDLEKIRDISPHVLDDNGRMRILPAAFWATTTAEERGLFGVRHGIYSFPTVELVERLKEIIAGRDAIEIGAGNGVLAEALDIPATDSMEQRDPAMMLALVALGQPPVTYGPNVVECHASRAVRRYRPQVVIACWVTQDHDGTNWKPGEGKLDGVDEADILRHCETYVLIGNEHIHKDKRIWSRRHTIEHPDYLYSRAMNGSRNFLAVWPGSKLPGLAPRPGHGKRRR